jgi:lipopolysaccharide biosynthesis glycosyltransferase
MQVVVASDERFAGQLSALMHSLSVHSPQIHLWILDCGLSAETSGRLVAFARERLAGVERLTVDRAALDGIDSMSWGSAALARLLIPALLPADLDRAIYLDADTLILAPIAPLWDLPLGENLVAGAVDPWAHAQDVVTTPYYANSGVLLMNIEAWRKERITDAALTFLNNCPYKFIDQSAINAVAAGRILPLASEWNYILGFVGTNFISLPPEQLPKIIHFAGCEPRPWAHRDAPYREIYLHHRQRGPLPMEARLRDKRGWARRSLGLLRRKPSYLLHALRRIDGREMAERYFSTLPD